MFCYSCLRLVQFKIGRERVICELLVGLIWGVIWDRRDKVICQVWYIQGDPKVTPYSKIKMVCF